MVDGEGKRIGDKIAKTQVLGSAQQQATPATGQQQSIPATGQQQATPPAGQTQQQQVTSMGGGKLRICPQCGIQNDPSNTFCSDCGFKFKK